MSKITVLAAVIGVCAVSPLTASGQSIPDIAWSRPIGASLDHAGHILARAADGIDDGYDQGLPVGGIGAGTFSRSYSGEFNRWHLKAGAHAFQSVDANQFSVYEKQEGSPSVAQVLTTRHPKGRLSSWQWDYPVGAGTYHALYPKSWWDYQWDKLPAHLVLEQFSPILPGDYKSSSLPVAVYRWHADNPTSKPVRVSIMFSWENMVGWLHQLNDPSVERMSTGNTDEFKTAQLGSGGAAEGIVFSKRAAGDTLEDWQGQFAIAALQSPGVEVSYHTTFLPNDPSGSAIWAPFSTTGKLDDNNETWVTGTIPEAGAICVSFVLQPGEHKIVPMALTWDFPVVQYGQGRKWLRKYTSYYSASGQNAWKLAQDALSNQQAWSDAIDKWQKPYVDDSSQPVWLRSMMLNELYYLADGGTFWGRPAASPHSPDSFAMLECFDYDDYASLDVAFYGTFGLLRFWPELEKTLLREFSATVAENDPTKYLWIWKVVQTGQPSFRPRQVRGALPHDLGSPREDPFFLVNEYSWQDSTQWKDLNSNFVLMAWRDYALTGSSDRQFLRDTYPSVKLAMDHLRSFVHDGDGLPENGGFPDQTFDEWNASGPSAYSGGLYLAALRAAARIAAIVGDTTSEQTFNRQFDAAQKSYIAELWTGSYFRYARGVDDIQAAQLAGQWYATLTGLGDLVPEAMQRSSLETIFKANVMGFQGGAMGAVNGRKYDGSALDGVQTSEVWTGVTLALASQMRSKGMEQEARQTAYGIYHTVYETRGYWFRTPEAWDGEGNFRASMYLRPGAVWAMDYADRQQKALATKSK